MKNNKPQINYYFMERLQQRFNNVNLSDIENILSESERFVPADVNRKFIPYPTLISKLRNINYSDSVYYVNKKLNAIFVTINDEYLVNCLYLDGSYGY
jgi:5-methylthioribose kinase